jgi:hypothetical protein
LRERNPSRKNVAVGQLLLVTAIQVSMSESAMDRPHRRVPVLVITRDPQPGKFMRGAFALFCALHRSLDAPGEKPALSPFMLDSSKGPLAPLIYVISL